MHNGRMAGSFTRRGGSVQLCERGDADLDARAQRGIEVGIGVVQPGEHGGRDAGRTEFERLRKIGDPEPIANSIVNYAVLGLSILFEGGSWFIALREFRKQTDGRGWFRTVRRSKDPTIFAVLFEDSAALIGLVIALVGIMLGDLLEMPILDGVASIGIALVLAATAIFLGYESQSLLTGEAAFPEVRQGIEAIARAAPGVQHINEVLTMHFGPEQVLAALSLDFDDRISAEQVEKAVADIERSVKSEFPEVTRIFVEAQEARTQRQRQA
jgi:divalent metal cation (Fe/Co/Zn/Cd) transporter